MGEKQTTPKQRTREELIAATEEKIKAENKRHEEAIKKLNEELEKLRGSVLTETQKQYDIKEKISSIDEQIERIKNPPDRASIDALRQAVEGLRPTSLFTSRSKREAWEFEKRGLENRERMIAQLEEQKAQYMEQLAQEDAHGVDRRETTEGAAIEDTPAG